MPDPLPYQERTLAEKEISRSNWRRWFGIGRADAWSALANELGAKFIESRWASGESVVLTTGPDGSWRIVLDLYVISTGKVTITFTRLRVPFVNPTAFRFSIHKTNFLTPLSIWLGAQDVQIGVPDFDEKFVIKSSHPAVATRLFANPDLLGLFLAEPDTAAQIIDHTGYFGPKFPPQTDLLQCMVHGDIRDLDRLHMLFTLCRTTLEQLSEIGIAQPGNPGVEL